MIKAALHEHLRTSSNLKPEDFNKAVDIARRRLGAGGVFALVNFADKRYEHFIESSGYERAYVGEKRNAVYVPEKDILVVKGQEVPTKQGHLLVLGLGCDNHIKQNKTLEDTLKQTIDNNAVAIIDHPYGSAGLGHYLRANSGLGTYEKLNEKFLGQVDAIEVYNGEAAFGIPFTLFPYNANKHALIFYRSAKKVFPHLGALSSSDGHSFYEFCSSWTEIEPFDIYSPSKLLPTLKKSIRKTNLKTQRQNTPSYRGAVNHIADLACIIIATKLGSKKFKVDNL